MTSTGGEPSSSTSAQPPPPTLPCQSAAARYSFHPLSHLYFCGDCSSPRCQLCAQSEIITHYCPSCLFEVPSASVKSERSRCPRNCFLCPVEGCGSYLSVWATDPRDVTRLESIEASVGRPPYYLICLQCKWDSKKSMRGRECVFEKPTGISSQMAALQGTHPGQVEMDKLRSHFESYVRKQNAASGSGNLPSSSSYSTLGRSKLARDFPGIENSKYLTGSSSSSRKGAAAYALDRSSGAEEKTTEVLPEYHSDYAAISGAVPAKDAKQFRGDEYGVMGQREERQRQWLHGLTGTQSSSISGVQERWRTGWDSGLRASDLDPLRVPLKTKVTLRCPACRHILVKPDPKASSYRWKIKLSALNYLAEIATTFKGVRGVGLVGAGGGSGGSSSGSRRESTLGRRTSAIGLRDRPGELRRPQSMLFNSSAASAAGDMISNPEKLRSGKTYDFELSFKNPLEEMIAVRLHVAQPTASSQTSTPPFNVLLSTHRFTVKPFDDVDIIDEELLSDPRDDDVSGGAGGGGGAGAGGGAVNEDHEDAFGAATSSSSSTAKTKRRAWEKGVLRKQSNETVIALRCEVREDALAEGRKARDVEVSEVRAR